jgi:hypothetical protein
LQKSDNSGQAIFDVANLLMQDDNEPAISPIARLMATEIAIKAKKAIEANEPGRLAAVADYLFYTYFDLITSSTSISSARKASSLTNIILDLDPYTPEQLLAFNSGCELVSDPMVPSKQSLELIARLLNATTSMAKREQLGEDILVMMTTSQKGKEFEADDKLQVLLLLRQNAQNPSSRHLASAAIVEFFDTFAEKLPHTEKGLYVLGEIKRSA